MAQAEGAGHRPLATSRLELNLVRLLCRCESMAAEKREPNEWRLEKVRDSHAAAEAAGPRGRRPTWLATPLLQALTSRAAPPLGARAPDFSRWPRSLLAQGPLPLCTLNPVAIAPAPPRPARDSPVLPPPRPAFWSDCCKETLGPGLADTPSSLPVCGCPGRHAAGPEGPSEVSVGS